MKRREFIKKCSMAISIPLLYSNAFPQSMVQPESATWEIDHDTCIGCGKCWGEEPGIFTQKEDKAIFNSENEALQVSSNGRVCNVGHGTEEYNKIYDQARGCPTKSINEIG